MNLASPTFIFLCMAGILVCRLVPHVTARDVALAGINLLAIAFALTSAAAAAVLGGLLLVVYVLGRIVVTAPATRGAAVVGTAVFALWATLFLLKDPALLPAINPFAGFPVAILGISYITFRCISYLMEISTLPNASPVRYLNYIIFFPTVSAGPIDRWRNFNATWKDPEPVEVLPALHRIANGFIKKFVLADNLASFSVAEVSALHLGGEASIPILWIAGALQLFLIYLDFSGYCDIVIGVARLMGVRVMENFNRPFLSRNVQEFWERWHISLSSLMRDYVFTPLTRMIYTRSPRSAQFPLVIASYFFVMILIVLWHGTSLGFLVFGVAHGAALVGLQLWRLAAKGRVRRTTGGTSAVLRTPLAMVATYCFVSYTLVLWTSVSESWGRYFMGMIGL